MFKVPQEGRRQTRTWNRGLLTAGPVVERRRPQALCELMRMTVWP